VIFGGIDGVTADSFLMFTMGTGRICMVYKYSSRVIVFFDMDSVLHMVRSCCCLEEFTGHWSTLRITGWGNG